MRRRWKWPIIDLIADLEEDDWAAVVIAWLVIGFVVWIIAAAISTDSHDNIAFDWSHPAVYVTIAWLGPFALAILGLGAWCLARIAPHLIPRRVTEPVREDLRDHERSTLH